MSTGSSETDRGKKIPSSIEYIPNVPEHLVHVRVVCDTQNRILLFNSNQESSIEVWWYNSDKKRWVSFEFFNFVTDGHSDYAVAKLDNNKLVLMFKNGNQSNIESYLIDTDNHQRAERFKTIGYPGTMNLHSACTKFGNQVFVTEFNSNDDKSDLPIELTCKVKLYVLNLDTLQWQDWSSEAVEAPHWFTRHTLKVFNNKLHVIGWRIVFGGENGETHQCDDVYCFDLSKRAWIRMTTIPDYHHVYPSPAESIVSSAPALYNDFAYVINGTTLWQLDLKDLQWKKLPIKITDTPYFVKSDVSVDGHLMYFYQTLPDAKRHLAKINVGSIFS